MSKTDEFNDPLTWENVLWLAGILVGLAFLLLVGQINPRGASTPTKSCTPASIDEIALVRMDKDGNIICEIHPSSMYQKALRVYPITCN